MKNRQRRAMTPLDISAYIGIPLGLITPEIHTIHGAYSDAMLEDLGRIIRYYEIYEEGVELIQSNAMGDDSGDYVPADLRYMQSANLIDKEARFIFGKPAEITLVPPEDKADDEGYKAKLTALQDVLDAILRRNQFAIKTLKGFKDCCIGERCCLVLDFSPERGCFIRYLPAYSFFYENDEYEQLSKLVVIYNANNEQEPLKQRVYKKKWWVENGRCKITEEVFDGTGQVIEDLVETETRFRYIPAYVILNDGLTGDENGVSEIKRLAEYEYWYTKLANADIDSEQKGMNPIKYAIDMDSRTTDREHLPLGPGAFWDLKSDKTLSDDETGRVGIIESTMNYSTPLGATLDRMSTIMHDTIDVPDVNIANLTGAITSGKTLKAIYWPLGNRSDEKMLAWEPAFQFAARTVLDGLLLYPEIRRIYSTENLAPETPCGIVVENPYSLPEDEAEEKQADLSEVAAGTMSRTSYMRKWRRMTPKEADAELRQIAAEKRLMDDSYSRQLYEASGQTVTGGNEDGEA